MLDTALIFAAGRGERLIPYTLNTPKPMLQIHNKPLLAYHLERLSQAGFKRVIINHAYLGGQIKAYFGQGQGLNLKIEYFAEPPGGLETGGTLAMIVRHFHFTMNSLLTINADIYTAYPFSPKLALEPNKDAHLILVPPPQDLDYSADFGLDNLGNVIKTPKQYIFSGIACYRLTALKQLPIGRYSIRDWLFNCVNEQRLSAEIYLGPWIDIGHPKRLKLAQS
jgi:MurNAc alpha-1-phosphate uridylyltransferase